MFNIRNVDLNLLPVFEAVDRSPLGLMIVLRLHERLALAAPNIGVAASTRSRPIDLDRALLEVRSDGAIDWIEPDKSSIARRNRIDLLYFYIALVRHMMYVGRKLCIILDSRYQQATSCGPATR
jgi:hypothetical protein